MAHGEKSTIVVGGHLCLDFIPGFPRVGGGQDWFRPGRLSIVNAPIISTGGAVSNVGIALHRLGVPVRLAARIGNDPLGRLIVDSISANSPDLVRDLRRVDGEASSYTVVLNPPEIDRIFFHCPGTNDTFTDADVPDSLLDEAALFHFGYPPLMEKIWSDGGVALGRLLARARARGAITSLDMSLPDPKSPSGKIDWDAYLSAVLPNVDLFVPSIEELLYCIDRPQFDRRAALGGGEAIITSISLRDVAVLAERVLERGPAVILIKLGHRGAYLRCGDRGLPGLEGWRDRELYTPVFKVPSPLWTTGSGDATAAGFLASVVRSLPPEDALTMAVASGGCCVEAPDATSGIRPWEETRSRVKDGWKHAQARIEEQGWRAAGALWRGPADC
ncbi:MAG: carbohydrate kinase family protein [Spirochaetia bacterium]|jgi:sugar/nucleoside kinase (ribokinase family)